MQRKDSSSFHDSVTPAYFFIKFSSHPFYFPAVSFKNRNIVINWMFFHFPTKHIGWAFISWCIHEMVWWRREANPPQTKKQSHTNGINAKRQSVDDLLLLYIYRNGTKGNYVFIKYRAFFAFYVIIMFSEHTNNIHMKWLSTFSYTYIIGIYIAFRGLFCSHSGNLCTCVLGDCLQNALSHLELLSRLWEIETFRWLPGLC